MSVAFFSEQEWFQIRDSLVHYVIDCKHSYGAHLGFAFEESKLSLLQRISKMAEDEAKEAMLTWFVKKLAIANQCAYYYNYSDEQPLLKFPKFSHRTLKNILSKKELFKKLSSVEYNCFDNNGTNFLPKKIDEQLRGLMLDIASNYFLSES